MEDDVAEGHAMREEAHHRDVGGYLNLLKSLSAKGLATFSSAFLPSICALGRSRSAVGASSWAISRTTLSRELWRS